MPTSTKKKSTPSSDAPSKVAADSQPSSSSESTPGVTDKNAAKLHKRSRSGMSQTMSRIYMNSIELIPYLPPLCP